MILNQSLWLYFVTWNVATQQPSQQPWELLGMNQYGSGKLPDFIVVGLQEVRARPTDVLYRIFFNDPWSDWLNKTLHDKDYVNIEIKRMQGLVLSVFCLRKHMVHLRQIEAHSTKIGFGGNLGNKGAVSVRFNIYGVSICILNSHLTAHYHNLDDRISDYQKILEKHVFDVPETPDILHHDYSFWLGDLNFRLDDKSLTPRSIAALVANKQLDFLLKRDQLKSVMKSGQAFSEFNEGNITFAPTYKITFPTRKYDLERRPSWTDRILYRVAKNLRKNVNLNAVEHNYKSHPYYTLSDHIPVTAEFLITTRPRNEEYRVEFEPIRQWLAGSENSATFKLFGGVSAPNDDWVGVYREGFSNIDDYVDRKHLGNDKSEIRPELKVEVREINFSKNAVRQPGTYRLVYVAKNEDGIKSILGMSQPFPVYYNNQK